MLKTQGSAQVRAATTQVQGRKWTLVGLIVVRDSNVEEKDIRHSEIRQEVFYPSCTQRKRREGQVNQILRLNNWSRYLKS